MIQNDPSVLAVQGACVRLALRGGAVVYGTVVAPRPAGSVVRVRPWGVSHTVDLDLAQIRAVSVAQVRRWKDVRKIASEQAHRWRRSA